MAIYNVYLVDFTYRTIGHHPEVQIENPVVLDSGKKQSIQSRLQSHFTTICETTNIVPQVQWAYPPSNIAPNELVCYCLESISDSIIRWKGWLTIQGEHDGCTKYIAPLGTLSEVYLNRNLNHTILMADLCMHEFMHNKLESHRSNRMNIHRQDQTGIGQAILHENQYTFTRWDINNMRASLRNNQRQILISQQEYLSHLQSIF